MKSFIILGCLFLFASCQSRIPVNGGLKPPPLPDEQPKAEFAERYKQYRCAEEVLPRVEESKGPGQRFRSMQFGEHLVLKFQLGPLIQVHGDASGPMRTKSRYRLFWDGEKVGEAESLFSTSNPGEGSGETLFYFDPASQSLLVFEELGWSTKRHMVFQRTSSSKKWTVKYLRPPLRSRAYLSPNSEDGRIRGIDNGILYLEMDGVLYAFPFDDFIATNLEFTVG